MVYTIRGKEAKKFLKKMRQKEKAPISKDEIALAKEIEKSPFENIPYKNKPKDYPFHNQKQSWTGWAIVTHEGFLCEIFRERKGIEKSSKYIPKYCKIMKVKIIEV